MNLIRHNPAAVFPPYRCYAHATEIRGDSRLLFVSGLNGYQADGKTLPESFDEQVRLGTQEISLTVVCCRLLDPRWKLEMEAVAARSSR